MKIDKITFKDNQAWVTIRNHNNDYLGTWHIVNPDFVEYIRETMPKEILFFRGAEDDKSKE